MSAVAVFVGVLAVVALIAGLALLWAVYRLLRQRASSEAAMTAAYEHFQSVKRAYEGQYEAAAEIVRRGRP